MGYDFGTGMKTFHDFDHSTKQGYTGYEAGNMAPLLDWTQYLRNTGIDDYNKKKASKHVACVPEWVQLKWLNDDGIQFLNPDHWDRVKAKLNDPEWAYLRTGSGQL